MIVVFSVIPAILVARGKKRFWQVALGTLIVFASGFFALLFLFRSDLPANTAKPWIFMAVGVIGITIGQRIVKANRDVRP